MNADKHGCQGAVTCDKITRYDVQQPHPEPVGAKAGDLHQGIRSIFDKQRKTQQ
jgi:hypothetical protein